jgi:putative transcriptional regulator
MKLKPNGRFRSDAFAAIHEAAEALRHVGAIDKVTMRTFDPTCLEGTEEAQLWRVAARRRKNVK